MNLEIELLGKKYFVLKEVKEKFAGEISDKKFVEILLPFYTKVIRKTGYCTLKNLANFFLSQVNKHGLSSMEEKEFNFFPSGNFEVSKISNGEKKQESFFPAGNLRLNEEIICFSTQSSTLISVEFLSTENLFKEVCLFKNEIEKTISLGVACLKISSFVEAIKNLGFTVHGLHENLWFENRIEVLKKLCEKMTGEKNINVVQKIYVK